MNNATPSVTAFIFLKKGLEGFSILTNPKPFYQPLAESSPCFDDGAQQKQSDTICHVRVRLKH